MELSTVTGLILGLVILAAALWLGHAPAEALLNPPAFLIVFGGTLTATLVSCNAGTLRHALKALFSGDSPEGRLDPKATVQYVMDIVTFVRDEGILALQPLLPSVEIPFLRKGLGLVLDNRPEKFIRESLSLELEIIYRQSLDVARVFETAGGLAPTMGIIGAVIGLMDIAQAMHDPAQLGRGVAGAFVATLYGVALSNLILLPLAGMLKRRGKDEWLIRTLLLEAILSVRSGEHPMLIRERLDAFTRDERREERAYASRPRRTGVDTSPPVLEDDFLTVPPPDAVHV